MADARIIRKYSNRRLYDTETSRHINQEDVRRLIADGEDVRIVDDATGDDITRSVLLQLVAEQELGGRPVLSDKILTQIIRYYDHPMQGMLGAYLQQSFEMFLEQQQNLKDHMRSLIDAGPFTMFKDLASQNAEAWLSMQKAFMKANSGKDDD